MHWPICIDIYALTYTHWPTRFHGWIFRSLHNNITCGVSNYNDLLSTFLKVSRYPGLTCPNPTSIEGLNQAHVCCVPTQKTVEQLALTRRGEARVDQTRVRGNAVQEVFDKVAFKVLINLFIYYLYWHFQYLLNYIILSVHVRHSNDFFSSHVEVLFNTDVRPTSDFGPTFQVSGWSDVGLTIPSKSHTTSDRRFLMF